MTAEQLCAVVAAVHAEITTFADREVATGTVVEDIFEGALERLQDLVEVLTRWEDDQ